MWLDGEAMTMYYATRQVGKVREKGKEFTILKHQGQLGYAIQKGESPGLVKAR